MPIYEYLCGECTHTLDALQKLSDEPLVYCPQCGAAALKRQMSAPSFRLKGGGWYETDFKSDKRRNISESRQQVDQDTKPADKPADDEAGQVGQARRRRAARRPILAALPQRSRRPARRAALLKHLQAAPDRGTHSLGPVADHFLHRPLPDPFR
jgi:putative FmdB family regulatory protein